MNFKIQSFLSLMWVGLVIKSYDSNIDKNVLVKCKKLLIEVMVMSIIYYIFM